MCYSRPKFRLDRFILSPSAGKKRQFLPYFAIFWTSAFSCVANWQQSEKVEHRCTTTNVYPTALKSFLYSNAFMAKSGAKALTFKSATNRQTDKQKLHVFGLPCEPNQTWHRDREPQARSCTSKHLGSDA